MNNFYYELDVESVLQCPVCYELPKNDIFLCKIGHHMCDKCRKRLPSCPTCQAALTGSRNFLAEALISKFAVFKGGELLTNNNHNQSTDSNLSIVSSRDTSATHISQNSNDLKALPLPEGIYRCMLESCRQRKGMGAGKLFPHLETVHSHLYEKFKNKSATFDETFKDFCFMQSTTKYHRAFHISNMGLFFLNLKVLDDKYINCWISTAAPIKVSNKFVYEIKFCKENDNSNLEFVSKMASNLQDTHWLLKRGRVFVIPPTSHKLKNGDFFSLVVKIVYKPPSDLTD